MTLNRQADLKICRDIRDQLTRLKSVIEANAESITSRQAANDLRVLAVCLGDLIHDDLDGGPLAVLKREIENEITDNSPVCSGMTTEDQRLDDPRHNEGRN